MNPRPTPSDCGCADLPTAHSLTPDQALCQIEAAMQPALSDTETLLLQAALDRVLAGPVDSPIAVPTYTNSAMDGYALRAADLPTSGTVALTQIGIAWAGRPFAGQVGPGQCVRIMTGAQLPDGADTVVMQEHITAHGDQISVDDRQQAGQNVRLVGEELQPGQAVLAAGKRLTAADIGLLASLGLAEVTVLRRLRVAFFSTGDELCAPGATLGAGQIYDSNRHSLQAMLSRLGVIAVDLGVVRDDRDAVRSALQTAAATADVVITSGGVSVGDADYVTEILKELGQVKFWKVAMKPGHPLTVGRIGNAHFFGLPGNPVSAMVTFYQFVQPGLYRLMGCPPALRLRFPVPCQDRLKKRAGRLEYQRGLLSQVNGQLVVHSAGNQGSHLLSSMSKANCFIILPADNAGVQPGELVEVEPFAGII